MQTSTHKRVRNFQNSQVFFASMHYCTEVVVLYHLLLCHQCQCQTTDHDWDVSARGNDSKSWMAYIKKLIQKILLDIISTNKPVITIIPVNYTRTMMIRRVSLLTHNKAPFYHPVYVHLNGHFYRNYIESLKPDRVVAFYPLFHLEVKQSHNVERGHFNWVSWTFGLDKGLALKILVNCLRIYSLQQHRCRYNLSFIRHEKYGSFADNTFCGIFSHLKCYPKGKNLSMNLFLHAMMSFTFSLSFDMIGSGIIQTTSELEVSLQSLSYPAKITKYHIAIGTVLKQIERMHIAVEKYQRILVSSWHNKNITCKVNEAPVMFSDDVVSNCKQNITTDTFQAVLKVVKMTQHSRYFIKFKARRIFPSHIVKIFNKESKQIASKRCHSSQKGCIDTHWIFAPKNMFVNISFTHFVFQGDNGSDCLYGGLAFFNMKKQRTRFGPIIFWQYETTVCTSVPLEWQNLQPIYAKTNEMLLVAYTYTGFSEMNFKAKIGYTHCQTVILNLCAIDVCLSQRRMDMDILGKTRSNSEPSSSFDKRRNEVIRNIKKHFELF